jgi:hypothetical protein
MKTKHATAPITAGLLALLSVSVVHAALLDFVPDANLQDTPLFDPDKGTLLSPATGGDVRVGNGETLTINTDTGAISKTGLNSFSSSGDTGLTPDGGNGVRAVSLFTFRNLSVDYLAVVTITGSRAVGLIARDGICINGTVRVEGKHAPQSGELGGAAFLGGFAGGRRSDGNGYPGGGITGYGGLGGASGQGGGGGRVFTDARLVDLLGGSGGGSGGAVSIPNFGGGLSGSGGGGGGAMLLLAQRYFYLEGFISAHGGNGGAGSTVYPAAGESAGGGGGGAGGSAVICAPGITLGINSQINLQGGSGGAGVGAHSGDYGDRGRLAIYSKLTPSTLGASISGTRYDHPIAAYPAALLQDGPAVISSFTMELANQSGGYIANLDAEGTPGVSYLLERSTNLTNWAADGSARTAGILGGISYTRTANPATLPKLFYRLRRL